MKGDRPAAGSEEPRRRTGFPTGWWSFRILVAALCYAPLLIQHGRQLWRRDYFIFYPVLLVGVVVAVASEIRRTWPGPTTMWRIEPVSFYASLFAMPVATILNSPWLAACSFLGLGDSLLNGFPVARRLWRVLLILIPLPLGYDNGFVHQMQIISSTYASRLLDALSVFHTMQGNILELSGRKFFVQEACSGLTSVYLILAATWFTVAYLQLRLIRSVPLILSSVWWSVVANIFRITVIALAHDRWQLDLTTGAAHEITGLVVMAVALALILMTKQWIDFLFAPVRQSGIDSIEDSRKRLTPEIVWNLLTSPRDTSDDGDSTRMPFGMEVRSTTLLRLSSVVLFLSAGVWIGLLNSSVLHGVIEMIRRQS